MYKRDVKSKQLTYEQRTGILQFLLQHKNDSKLKRGIIGQAAMKFDVSRLTVTRIWNRAKEQYREGHISADVASRKRNCGRKRKNYLANLEKIKEIPLNRRGTIRSLSFAINIPKSTVFRIFKEGRHLRRISSIVRPLLTEGNKRTRLEFCLSKIKPNRRFEDMYDYVHIDEKWFYLSQVKRSYYLMLDEAEPKRYCKSKRFITKVMFMAAVARPRYDSARKQYFNGKIGLWPFVYKEPAKRTSKNRGRGTMVTKNIESINAAECKKMIIDNLLPAIRSKFPKAHKAKTIYVQQDNAKPHCCNNDAELLVEGSRDGWCIKFKSQPPNSPDLNVLDLGFFNAIQSLQHQASPKTMEELITCVENAFDTLTKEKLDNVFLTLQKCMESTMLASGGNDYKIQHISKEKLRREGRLPVSITCSQTAIETAKFCLNM